MDCWIVGMNHPGALRPPSLTHPGALRHPSQEGIGGELME